MSDMRRIFLCVLALTLCFLCDGKVVDVQTAGRTAGKVLSSNMKKVQRRTGSVQVRTSSTESPAYHIFQDENGWVIIAGEDCAVPILARGNGVFPEDLPDAMLGLLDCYEEEISFARKHRMEADAQTRRMWENPHTASMSGTGSVGPLTADIKWNQSGSPFDDKTPLINGKKAPAGCVASAIGIVLRYYKWPLTAKGTLPSYSYGEGTLPELEIEGHVYDWDSMPLNPKKEGTTEGKEAIATLLAHIGQAVKMDYDVGSSGAYGSSIAPALRKYFSYKGSLVRLFRNDYSNEEWFNMLRVELDKGRPLIYNAASSNGAHSFVCDGYDLETKMISVNFGWGGGGNGWYVMNTVRNISLGDDALHGGYPIEHEAIFGMLPDTDGTGSDPVSNWIGLRIDSSNGGYGLGYSSPQSVVKGQNFEVELNRFANFYSVPSMKYKMVLTDRDNNERAQISDEIDVSFENGSSISKYATSKATCLIKNGFVIGDRIRCLFSTTDGTVWYPMGCTTDQISSSETRAMHEMGVYDLDIIDLPSEMKNGQVLYLNVLYSGHKAYKSVDWVYDGVELEKKYPSVLLKTGTHRIKAIVTYIDDTIKTIECEFTISK